MKVVMLAVAMITLVTLGPGWAAAQQMAPHDDTMMMHGKTLVGVVTRVRFVSCGNTPQSCQGIFEVTPGESGMMMHQPAAGDQTMMEHPVTLIVVPGSALMWQNAPLALTHLKVGDQVKLEYATLDNMNIVTTLTMTGMGHM